MTRDLSSPRPLVEEKPQLHFIDLEREGRTQGTLAALRLMLRTSYPFYPSRSSPGGDQPPCGFAQDWLGSQDAGRPG